MSALSILVFGAGGQLGSELVARPHSPDVNARSGVAEILCYMLRP